MTTTLKAAKRGATLAAQVAEQIERMIVSGEWRVGTRIPPESDLLSRLGVSRNTVREALRSLVHLGFLEARPGDGTYVRALSELEMPLVRRANRARLADAVEVRAILEQQAARLAAIRRSDEQVEQLRRLLGLQREASARGDLAAYSEIDAELHRTVVACSGNAFLTEIYEHLGGALKLSVSPELWDQLLADEELDLHEALIDAIAANDAAGAEGSAKALVETLTEALLPMREKRQPSQLRSGSPPTHDAPDTGGGHVETGSPSVDAP